MLESQGAVYITRSFCCRLQPDWKFITQCRLLTSFQESPGQSFARQPLEPWGLVDKPTLSLKFILCSNSNDIIVRKAPKNSFFCSVYRFAVITQHALYCCQNGTATSGGRLTTQPATPTRQITLRNPKAAGTIIQGLSIDRPGGSMTATDFHPSASEMVPPLRSAVRQRPRQYCCKYTW